MIEKAILKLKARDTLSAEEEDVLREAIQRSEDVPSDRILVRPGEELSQSILLLDGLVCRYKDMRNGERQIMELHVPGDFLDLHGFLLKRLDHHVMSLVPSRVAFMPHARLERISREHPHLTRLLWLTTLIDAAIHREWLVSLGRRTALARLGHLFCEMHARLCVVGLAAPNGFPLPITQADLAECLGLTSVHVNRVLRRLREEGLATFRDSWVEILDSERLRRIAEFDPDYLQIERRPR
ncbi:MAG: Crp/Fnr family transcriptional regulator [Sphingomonadaceae bacterium]|nr:Crp/Fnr family transcriptional regulator [Sphingomonadaceae bacterium]